MHCQIDDVEWIKLSSHLGAGEHDQRARRAAQACLYRYTVQQAERYRSFGWAKLPESFGVSGSTANRRFVAWTESGVWFAFWDALIELRFGRAKPEPVNRRALRGASPLEALILELARAYRYFNLRFLGGELPADAVITVEGQAGRSAKGYLSPALWSARQTRFHHIALLAPGLQGAEAALGTLLHEMAHLRNLSLGLLDTDSRTQYHRQEFRDVARLLGLECMRRDPDFGYAHTLLGVRARQAIATLRPVEDVYATRLGRAAPEAG